MDMEIFYSYNADQFVIETEKGKESEFDRKLKLCWEKKMANNCFRYSLENVETRYIPGKYGFVAQLNIKRAVIRRKAQSMTSVMMPFDPEKFHFGKIDVKEILFQLLPVHWEEETFTEHSGVSSKNVMIINTSPLEYCNSLLLPSIDKHYPQILNFNGLRLALETILISHDPCLKIGMNSLGANASVNHLHFHIYYLKEALYVQYAPVKNIIGDCFEFVDYPGEGFVFELQKKENIQIAVGSIMKLVELLQREGIAHNIFIARGKSFKDSVSPEKDFFNSIRIIVWARKSFFGSKDETNKSFNTALCELAGHIIMKEKLYFQNVTEDDVACTLRDTCHDTYIKVYEKILTLYS